MHLRN